MKNKENVLDWAEQRGLLKPENAKTQLIKVYEELGELSSAILKNHKTNQIDGLGDTLVTIIILADILGFDIEDCLQVAYNEIKNRTGKTVNGTFIKE